ncbi:MAG: hypothetical protein HYY92_01440, partial [Parcubacteria group bacterium]|nr:hypothetical protein [Parcubacteria group bacterium]
NGGTMWSVHTHCGEPSDVLSEEVVGTGTYDDPSSVLHGKAVYYCTWNEKPFRSFVEDLQNHPAKAVFTSQRAAERFSNAAHIAFASDLEWQAGVAIEKMLSDEYDSWSEMGDDDPMVNDAEWSDGDYGDDKALRSMDLA